MSIPTFFRHPTSHLPVRVVKIGIKPGNFKRGFPGNGATASKFGMEKHPDQIVPVCDSRLPFTSQASLAIVSCFFSFLRVDTGGYGLQGVVTKAGNAGYGVSSLSECRLGLETVFLAWFALSSGAQRAIPGFRSDPPGREMLFPRCFSSGWKKNLRMPCSNRTTYHQFVHTLSIQLNQNPSIPKIPHNPDVARCQILMRPPRKKEISDCRRNLKKLYLPKYYPEHRTCPKCTESQNIFCIPDSPGQQK